MAVDAAPRFGPQSAWELFKGGRDRAYPTERLPLSIEGGAADSSFSARWVYWLAGVDADVITHCPERDRAHATTIGCLSLLVWLFQALLISFSLTMAFGTSPAAISGCAVCGLIGASLILGFDNTMIRGAWSLHGIKSLRAAGLQVERTLLDSAKTICLCAARFGLSAAVANLVATLFLLFIFGADLEVKLKEAHFQENAQTYQHASTRVDAAIKGHQEEFERDSGLIKKLDEEAEHYRRIISGQIPPGTSGELDLLQENIRRLEGERANTEGEAFQYEKVAENERHGVKETTESGIPGTRGRYYAAAAKAKKAREREQQLSLELSAVRSRLHQVRQEADLTGDKARSNAEAMASAVEEHRKQAIARQAVTEHDLRQLAERRDASIVEAARKDPSFLPMRNGPLARFKALYDLLEDPAIFSFALAIELFIMGLELSAVIAKLTNFIPTTYALMVAQQDYGAATRAIAEMQIAAAELVVRIETAVTRSNTLLSARFDAAE